MMTTRNRSKSAILVFSLIAAACALFVGANAHLLFVAYDSDPGCVAHLKVAGTGPGQFKAAKSSC